MNILQRFIFGELFYAGNFDNKTRELITITTLAVNQTLPQLKAIISVITKGKVKNTKEYYDTKTTFSFVENENLMTFCEVKQFNPFPELLFNFMGVLNELKIEYMTDDGEELKPLHRAPSLMISGKPNKQTQRIKESLENRYCINVIYDLFYTGLFTFSRGNVSALRQTGKNP